MSRKRKTTSSDPVLQSRPRHAEMVKPVVDFYIARLKPVTCIDAVTKRWIRNAADERAAQSGFRFSERRGEHVVNWIERYCILYEGDKAGQRMDIEDWQYEYFMQVFGWVYFSEDWQRWIRRFREASVWIAKKNFKSPTLAATGLYLLCGDGEYGQKCYSLARDTKQAMIAHNHVVEMVLASRAAGEPLGLECSYNKTTGTITHEPTRSRYFVVAGDNPKSTEGFNGSLLVDEVHVVDFKLMHRVKRATISRSEPLHVEMSTAGDNADSYGFHRYEQGKRHVACESDRDYNPYFYFLDYSIPQDTPIEALYDESTIRRLGRLANPTMGRNGGILQAELMADWHNSVGSQTELRRFGMYRLNLWLKSAANWIAIQDWLACGKEFSLTDLMEYPCVGGLDLSKTLDMTALCLMFSVPDEEFGVRPHVWFWFWLPEDTAKRYQNQIDFYRWSKYIKIVPGRTIDYELVADKLQWCAENLDFHGCGYDPYNSDKLMLILYNDYGWGEEMMTPVKQNMATMAPPTAEVERLILRREIAHNRNPVMAWQFSNCQVLGDRQGNRRPIKPTKDDYRKIDGIIALVIAQAMFDSDPTMLRGHTQDSILLFNREERDRYATPS